MNKKTKILLVEDDPNLGTLLSEYLVAKGNECTLRTNGKEGFETFVKGAFDFLILDVMMPVKDGFTMAKEIRGIDMEELLVRMGAILRRTQGNDEQDQGTYNVGTYQFDFNQRLLINGSYEQKLTTKENALLKLLCKNINGVLERNHALNAVWGDDNYFNGRSMDVYIA